MSITKLAPRPIRDLLFTGPAYVNNAEDAVKRNGRSQGAVDLANNGSDIMNKAGARIALAILGTFLLMNSAPAVSFALGAAVSLPATLIVGGSWLAINGITTVITSLGTGSLATFAAGLTTLFAGWLVLENHDYKHIEWIGLGEKFVMPTLITYGRPMITKIVTG